MLLPLLFSISKCTPASPGEALSNPSCACSAARPDHCQEHGERPGGPGVGEHSAVLPRHRFAACIKSWLLRWLSFCLSAWLLQASSTTSPCRVSPVTGVCGLAYVVGEPQRDGDVSEVPSSEGCWQRGWGILQCSAGTAAGGGAGPPSSGSVHIQSERQKPRFLF